MEDTEDEIERFEGDDPITGSGNAFSDGMNTDGGVGFVGGDEEEDFRQVAVVERDVVVSGGFENGDFQGGGIGAAAGGGDFGKADAGLVFHGVDGLPELAGHG